MPCDEPLPPGEHGAINRLARAGAASKAKSMNKPPPERLLIPLLGLRHARRELLLAVLMKEGGAQRVAILENR